MTAQAERNKNVYGEYFAGRITAAAERYRAIADRLDAYAAQVPELDATTRFGSASNMAQLVVSEAMWGAANAKLESVIAAAAEYDRNTGGAS